MSVVLNYLVDSRFNVVMWYTFRNMCTLHSHTCVCLCCYCMTFDSRGECYIFLLLYYRYSRIEPIHTIQATHYLRQSILLFTKSHPTLAKRIATGEKNKFVPHLARSGTLHKTTNTKGMPATQALFTLHA